MTEEESNPKRMDQWLVRSIAIITSLVFTIVILLSLVNLQENILPSGIDSTIGESFWTFRVFDLIFLTIVLFLVLISSIYLIKFDSSVKNSMSRERRGGY